jgi:hypothetical protein
VDNLSAACGQWLSRTNVADAEVGPAITYA